MIGLVLLGVLPGTGGVTRLIDKRKVRKDLADIFCTNADGIRGKKAVEWKLVDYIAPPSKFDDLTESDYVGFSNNVTRVTYVYGADEGTEVLNFTYDYNDAGYPRNVIVKSPDSDDDESTIVIEYYQ